MRTTVTSQTHSKKPIAVLKRHCLMTLTIKIVISVHRVLEI